MTPTKQAQTDTAFLAMPDSAKPPKFRLSENIKNNISPDEDAEITILKNIIRDEGVESATKRLLEMISHSRFRSYWASYSDNEAIRIWKYVRRIQIVPKDFIWAGMPMPTAMVYLRDGRMFINAQFILDNVQTGGDLLWLAMHERDHLVLSKLYGLGRWGYSPLGMRQQALWSGLMNLGEDAYINAKLRNRIKSTMIERFYLTMGEVEMALTTGFTMRVLKSKFKDIQWLHHRLQNETLLKLLGQPKAKLTVDEKRRMKDGYAVDIDYLTWIRAWAKATEEFLAEEEEGQEPCEGDGEDDGESQGEGQGQGQGDAQGQGDDGDQGGDDQGQGQGDQQSSGYGKGTQNAKGPKRVTAQELIDAAMQGNHDGSMPVTETSEKEQGPLEGQDNSSRYETTKQKFGNLDDDVVILILDTEPPHGDFRRHFPDLRADLSIPLEVLNQTLGDFVSKHASDGDAATGYSMSVPNQLTQHDLRALACDGDIVMWEQTIGSDPEPVDVYMDISGSMTTYIPLVPCIVEALHRHIRKVYHFASAIEEVEPLTDEYGGVGGGTDFEKVAETILENPPGHVIIFSDDDGYVEDEQREAVEQHCLSLILLYVGRHQGPWRTIASDVVDVLERPPNT